MRRGIADTGIWPLRKYFCTANYAGLNLFQIQYIECDIDTSPVGRRVVMDAEIAIRTYIDH